MKTLLNSSKTHRRTATSTVFGDSSSKRKMVTNFGEPSDDNPNTPWSINDESPVTIGGRSICLGDYQKTIRELPKATAYAGIGARTTPQETLQLFHRIGKVLGKKQYILRSGGARGADTAFQQGADASGGNTEIFLPYPRFNYNSDPVIPITREARLLAKLFHPNWPALGDTGRDFMGRNCYQILSPSLDSPVSFVICWTPNGRITGGTGQALRMANYFGIPVFNAGSMSEQQISDGVLDIIGVSQ